MWIDRTNFTGYVYKDGESVDHCQSLRMHVNSWAFPIQKIIEIDVFESCL